MPRPIITLSLAAACCAVMAVIDSAPAVALVPPHPDVVPQEGTASVVSPEMGEQLFRALRNPDAPCSLAGLRAAGRHVQLSLCQGLACGDARIGSSGACNGTLIKGYCLSFGEGFPEACRVMLLGAVSGLDGPKVFGVPDLSHPPDVAALKACKPADTGFTDGQEVRDSSGHRPRWILLTPESCRRAGTVPGDWYFEGSDCAPALGNGMRTGELVHPGHIRTCAAVRSVLSSGTEVAVEVPARPYNWSWFRDATVRLALYRMAPLPCDQIFFPDPDPARPGSKDGDAVDATASE